MCLAIRTLNDAFRSTFFGGKVNVTRAVDSLPSGTKLALLRAVQEFNRFDDDNDPYGEHDFGSVELEDDTYFWKLDCYDKSLRHGSPDAADPSKTTRVLTIMHASEY